MKVVLLALMALRMTVHLCHLPDHSVKSNHLCHYQTFTITITTQQ